MIKELRQKLNELSPTTPEYRNLKEEIEGLEDLMYLIDEGFVDIQESDDNQLRLFPKGECWEAEPFTA